MLETGFLTRQINENIITFYIILTSADQTAYLKPQSHIHGFGPGRATVHPDLASR